MKNLATLGIVIETIIVISLLFVSILFIVRFLKFKRRKKRTKISISEFNDLIIVYFSVIVIWIILDLVDNILGLNIISFGFGF